MGCAFKRTSAPIGAWKSKFTTTDRPTNQWTDIGGNKIVTLSIKYKRDKHA